MRSGPVRSAARRRRPSGRRAALRLAALLVALAPPPAAADAPARAGTTPVTAGTVEAADAPAVPRFADETATAGLGHSYAGGWEFMVGGGVAAFDCSGDGRPDLAFAGGAAPAAVFVNESPRGGPLGFRRVEGSGIEIDAVTGLWPLDIDGDGVTDLALSRRGEDMLLRGLGGCRFARANEAWGFAGGADWSAAFAATWEEGNAWPTLAFGSYIDPAQEDFPWGSCTDNRLHRPRPGGGYAPPIALSPGHCALSMLFTDWNRSGEPALRISNDREYYKGGEEQLWRIPPGAPPRLYTAEEGWQRLRIWGMGIASHDLDGDGLPEYFLTSMADNKLQRLVPQPGGTALRPDYEDVAFRLGVTAHRPYTGGDPRPSTAWHAEFADVNNDGRADLFVAKGNVDEMPDFARADPNNLLLQRPDGRFEETGDRAGVASVNTARGAAVVDLDLDGWLDLVVVNRRDPVEVWRNLGTGAPGAWVALRLAAPPPNRDAIGAWVEVRTPDGRVQRREVTAGGGHGGGQLGWLHFGLGSAASAEARVIWPGGLAGPWAQVAPGAFHVLAPGAPPEVWQPPG
jgi:hypothetical protein